MGAFSGDGAGCTARLLKKYGATVLGGIHLKMPDSVCDSKLLKKTVEQNRDIILQADKKTEDYANQIRQGKYPKDGITLRAHMAGLLGQRLWFYKNTAGYTDKCKISDGCIGCGLCVSLCPMKNISIRNGKAFAKLENKKVFLTASMPTQYQSGITSKYAKSVDRVRKMSSIGANGFLCNVL